MVGDPHSTHPGPRLYRDEDGPHRRLSSMQRSVPWFWLIALALLLVAPGLTARLFVDVLEGVTLLLVLGPLVLAGGGFLAWQWAKRRMTICPVCATPSFAALQCPACGASLVAETSAAGAWSTSVVGAQAEQAASDAVVDVQVSEVRDSD